MGHTLTFTIDDGMLRYPKVTCTEPPDADCHLSFDCGCEEYDEILTDDHGKYHERGEESVPSLLQPGTMIEVPVKHRLTLIPGRCNIRDWLENADEVQEDGTAPVDVVIPFEPVWTGDFYQWKPLVRTVGGA